MAPQDVKYFVFEGSSLKGGFASDKFRDAFSLVFFKNAVVCGGGEDDG